MKSDQYIYGLNPVTEALRSGRQVEKILIRKGIQPSKSGPVMAIAKEFDIPVQFVPVEKLNSITRNNHQGIVAFFSGIIYQKTEELVISAFERGEIPIFLLLDRITDVRNFGSIARSAECAAVNGIIIPSRGSALITADAVKASSGALNHVPVAREPNLNSTVKYLKDSGIQLIAATEKADKPYDLADYTLPTAIIMGSEEDGISPELLSLSDTQVKIPVEGKTLSLNVSVAAGILIFEARRQRMQKPA
ncbi:MAG: 23S rRNA (guanosine(2251)-2'-O)-methyltransferase RlmB [Bacteroidales bacterium]|nr:23S rRNA (guanosine(2251)-2'-O)-methyltransferase RlmB [Bacteroidales bacterium]